VPGTIKDIVLIDGWPVRYGSASTEAAPCTADAPSVARMRAAGIVFLGVTTTPEFGWKAVTDSPAFGITRNPWDPALTPGGSSGGAAVAAATGAGVFHLGTDGGGSIRIPSAFTGISGIKPTFGRVPAYPASPFGTVAHIGPMCRRPGDTEALLATMSGRDLSDWFQGAGVLDPLTPQQITPRGLRIGVWRTPPSGSVAPAVAAQFDRSLAILQEAGAILTECALPMQEQLLDLFNWHWMSGAATRLAALDPSEVEAIDPNLLDMATQASAWKASDYIAAMNRRAVFGSEMDRLLEDYDFIVSPAAALLPFTAGEELPEGSGLSRWIEWAGFSYPINLSQQPAMSVPAGCDPATGLPHALQIIAGRGRDAAVLALAKWWEAANPDFFL
jgi:amidase/aspartyl-tRNA(Asn)/glutamyl-tRNA(Gln) amidotransferase subunit A